MKAKFAPRSTGLPRPYVPVQPVWQRPNRPIKPGIPANLPWKPPAGKPPGLLKALSRDKRAQLALLAFSAVAAAYAYTVGEDGDPGNAYGSPFVPAFGNTAVTGLGAGVHNLPGVIENITGAVPIKAFLTPFPQNAYLNLPTATAPLTIPGPAGRYQYYYGNPQAGHNLPPQVRWFYSHIRVNPAGQPYYWGNMLPNMMPSPVVYATPEAWTPVPRLALALDFDMRIGGAKGPEKKRRGPLPEGLFYILNNLTEFKDFWDVLLDAMGWEYNKEIGGNGIIQQINWVMDGGWQYFDAETFVKGLIAEALTDLAYGIRGQIGVASSRKLGMYGWRTINTGPLF